MRVINDTHVGALRSAGTTLVSQSALSKHILSRFQDLLPDSGDLLINGDLFDTHAVPVVDVLATYERLSDWLHEHPIARLYNVAGNHDLSKTSTTMSSFQFLGRLLSRQFPDRYVHIEEPTNTPYGYVIPHLANQTLFNEALAAMPKTRRLFLHCNLGNKFAENSDQSLNLSMEALEALPADEVLLGHEHKHRRAGKALVLGNQIATSVADWLGPDKYYAEVDNDATRIYLCASKSTEFVEQDWRALSVTDHKFVRVVGDANADESFEVVTAINKFRRQSSAFVVSNAVNLTSDEGKAFSANLESVKAFSILSALKTYLTEAEFKKIERFTND